MNMASNHITGKEFITVFVLCISMVFSCVEPFEDTNFNERFEDVLVVNSTITNEFKNQKVVMTRSFMFDDEGASAEGGATVIVIDDLGTEYLFVETKSGIYSSIQPFKAELGRNYTLRIVTSDGKSYASNEMELPVESTKIDDLYAQRTINKNEEDGMAIYIDSYDPSGNSRYYRHEFTETFKIIAPYWTPYDAVVISEGISSFDLAVILREQEERVCYGENISRSPIVASTAGFTEDRLENYGIRFINKDDYILSYRYSILVRQYALSKEAFSYYETLSGLSQDGENIFSNDQPGFFAGNIKSIDNPNENVVGFFDVAATDEQRIFFSYEDFFPGEELPPFTSDCIITAPLTEGTLGERALLNLIYDDVLRYYGPNNGVMQGGPMLMVRKECGDCTVLGSNKIPEFWIE